MLLLHESGTLRSLMSATHAGLTELITYFFALYLQHGRHDVNANHQYNKFIHIFSKVVCLLWLIVHRRGNSTSNFVYEFLFQSSSICPPLS